MNRVHVIDQADGVRVVVTPKSDETNPAAKILNVREGDSIEVLIKCNLDCDHKFAGKVKYDPENHVYNFEGKDLNMPIRTLLKMGATLKVIPSKKSE